MAVDLSGRRILITGASGFIGAHLCRRLLQHGGEIHALTRENRASEQPRLRWWKGDASDSACVQRLFAEIKPDLVYHLASHVAGARDLQMVLPTFHSNLMSSVNVLTGAAEAGCPRVVLTGSMEEPAPGSITAVPCSPYAAAKWASTAYALMFNALYSLPVVVLRVFMVYGPGQPDHRKLIPYTILSLLRGEAPKFSSGTRRVDWVYVDDVVDGFVAAAAPNVPPGPIDIGSGELVSVRGIVEKIAAVIDPGIALNFGGVADRPLEVEPTANLAETFRLLGWRPKTPLAQGLQQTVEWYRRSVKG